MDERVERGMRRQLAAAPDDRIGWKMALNAPAIMEALGLPEPALGWLSRERVATGEHSLAGSANPAVEPELLLEAGEGGGRRTDGRRARGRRPRPAARRRSRR